VIAAGIVVTFIVTIQSVRLANIAEHYIYFGSQMKYPVRYAVFTEPYMYVVMNLENFVYAAPKIIDHTYGLFTFDFIAALSGVKHSLAEYLNVTKFPHYISGYNTFPFFWAYYYDYGLLGLAFIPFILGLIFSEIFYALHRNPTLVNLAMYCVVFSILVISIFSDPLTRLDMMFNFVFIIMIQRYISIDHSAIQTPPKSLNIQRSVT
jgi:oligosaccharide repeat unit polymerase